VEDVITLYPCSSGGESKHQSVPWRIKGGRTEITEKDYWSGRIFPVILVYFLGIFMCVSPYQPARFRTCDDPSIIIMGVDDVKHFLGLFVT
jgi:hypothetical protein